MAFVTLFVFVIWMYQVRLLIALLLGLNASFSSLREFITVVLTTNEGLLFLAIGNAGRRRAVADLFSLTVVSFPLLLDRDVDFVTAMITSVRAVVTSPLPMIGWAAIIVILLAVSAVPYFLGLVVTLPVLGPHHLAPLPPDHRAGAGLECYIVGQSDLSAVARRAKAEACLCAPYDLRRCAADQFAFRTERSVAARSCRR
jgi:hypothetical protein